MVLMFFRLFLGEATTVYLCNSNLLVFEQLICEFRTNLITDFRETMSSMSKGKTINSMLPIAHIQWSLYEK